MFKLITMIKLFKIACFAFMLSMVASVIAPALAAGGSGLAVPRFVTLTSNEVNLRTGPGLKYPIEWVLVREDMPVEVTREFDTWREIKTIDGDTGWVHGSMLSGKRFVVITPYTQKVYKKASLDSRPLAQVEPGVIAEVNECSENWCYLDVLTYDGWLEKTSLWGVYDHEIIE